MKTAGIILGGAFISLPSAAAENSMLTDFAQKVMTECGIGDIKVINNGSLKDAISETEADAFFVLAADTAVGEVDFVSAFCRAENVRFISEDGEFIGAVITDAMDTGAVYGIEKTEVISAKKITAKNLSEITDARMKSVRDTLAEGNVFTESGAVISPLAKVGKGSFIASGCRIDGSSVIGDGCTLTGATIINNSKIGNNTSVTSCVILESEVGDNVSAGPFAYIRPHSKVGNNVKVGDFVEIKNAVIGNGTKISHLTYVGDSDVGSGVNFGCGTVTVNYDGLKKHRTVIGDNAFIGCNTNLVAPVTVGEGAFIAAGSTITDDMPALSFAIARQRQTTKENYVSERMPDMVKKTNKE